MINYTWKTYPNIGYIIADLTEVQLEPIKQEINKIKNNFTSYSDRKANYMLAGNITDEFKLVDCNTHVEELLKPLCFSFDKQFNYFNKNFDTRSDLYLGKLWVNFQKKNEFNPIHNHSGALSFVIWIDIPYDIEDEKQYSPGKDSNNNVAGNFQILYLNSLGEIKSENIAVDKKFNNKILLFPSSLNHTVYPFYTSDEYRISVSGNFYLTK